MVSLSPVQARSSGGSSRSSSGGSSKGGSSRSSSGASSGGSSSGAPKTEIDRIREAEAKRQAEIRSGTRSINSLFDSQFNNSFFNRMQRDYLDYARPQIQDQYDDAAKQLTFSLARSGVLNSSMRAEQEGDLQKRLDALNREASDTALAQSNQARAAVGDARGNLIGMLNNTGNARAAVDAANARAMALSQPEPYSPLVNLFADFTGNLAAHNQGRMAAHYMPPTNRPPSMFGPQPGSVRNI